VGEKLSCRPGAVLKVSSPLALSVTGPRPPSVVAPPTRGEAIPAVERSVFRRRVAKRTLKHLHEVENAVQEIDALPARDESIHCIMRGNYHGWDIVPAVLHLAKPATIAQLYVATLGFNVRNAGELLRLFDERLIGRVVFLCSHYFQKASPEEFALLRTGLAARGQTIVAARTHAKVLAMALTDGRQLVVESSANLRSCNNLEQLCLTESPDLFDFHAAWIAGVAAKINAPR
jgi:hypothetical protein